MKAGSPATYAGQFNFGNSFLVLGNPSTCAKADR